MGSVFTSGVTVERSTNGRQATLGRQGGPAGGAEAYQGFSRRKDQCGWRLLWNARPRPRSWLLRGRAARLAHLECVLALSNVVLFSSLCQPNRLHRDQTAADAAKEGEGLEPREETGASEFGIRVDPAKPGGRQHRVWNALKHNRSAGIEWAMQAGNEAQARPRCQGALRAKGWALAKRGWTEEVQA